MRASYGQTAEIAEHLGSLLRAGLPTENIFSVLQRRKRPRAIRRAIEGLREAVMNGRTYYEGLQSHGHVWPEWFKQLIHCSETTGALHAGFEEGAQRLHELGRLQRRHPHGVAQSPRSLSLGGGWRMWFSSPLFSAGAGMGIPRRSTTAKLYFASPLPPLCAFISGPIRVAMDRITLELPLLSETVRDVSLYRFTICFRALYMGGLSAVEMIRLAAQSVGNSALRKRLASAVASLEAGRTFAEALEPCVRWPDGFIPRIDEAEQSGQLAPTLGEAGERPPRPRGPSHEHGPPNRRLRSRLPDDPRRFPHNRGHLQDLSHWMKDR